MGSRQGNKLTPHVEPDCISQDSLSFSGLVSVQDQQPKFPCPNQSKHYHANKQDPEFEFTSTKANLNSAVNPIKITPADLLISNGQLQPQALAFQTTQSLTASSLSSLVASHSSSKMSSGKTGSAVKYQEQVDKASKRTNKESTVRRAQSGKKIKCFLSPCRNTRAIKPSAVKAQTGPRENVKIY